MPQVRKPEVRRRIEDAALRCFADRGYARTSVAAIAEAAGTAPANVYRYVPDKEVLFRTVVPPDLPDRHDALLDTRVAALATPGRADVDETASALLDFWVAHRLAVVVLLDRADGTPYAGYPDAFVARLVSHVEGTLDAEPTPDQHELLHLVFDQTRRALARILYGHEDPQRIRALVAGFWAYQVPGLDGLLRHLAAAEGTAATVAAAPARGDVSG
jgi:AcrR family transcriptional regulator